MRDQIESALRGLDAEHVSVHVEEYETSRMTFRGRDVEDVGRSRGIGGNIRAFAGGGWGFVSFNDFGELRSRAELAIHQAKLAGGSGNRLADRPVRDVVVPAHLLKDPRTVSLTDKKRLLDEYIDVMFSVPQIHTTEASYWDGARRVVYADSEGCYVEQSFVDLKARFLAVARRNGTVQQAILSMGSLGDFAAVEQLHDKVRTTAERAVRLLDAKSIESGEYTVVCDQALAGVFAHEAFGHLSEADFIYENDRMQEIMVLGRQFGTPMVSIVDDATLPGLRGSYAYDDEGTAGHKNYLLKNGELVGRLHSRETAAKLGEEPTGNARAISYRHEPLVRMTNTYIEPGTATPEELIADVKDGIYAVDWYGGTTTMEMFTFSAAEAYRIRNGRLEEPLRGVVLSGNLFDTLQRIDGVAGDLAFAQGGGCGKGGQSPLPVSTGAPHIRIQSCVVGGGG